MFDYGWRQYLPDLGRWNGIDQLSESYLSTSPYAYVANNPVSQFDVDGRWFNEDGTIDTSGRTPGFTSGRQMYSQFLGQRPGDGGGNSAMSDPTPKSSTGPGVIERFISWLFGGNKKRSNRLTVGTPERLPDGHTRLFGLIKNANGQSPLEAYRESQSNSLYNPGETSLDRSFRLISSSHIEIMQDFGGGGYNMFGGYGRITKAANALAATEETGNSISKILSSTDEFDPLVTLFRGTTGSESGSSLLFLTDDAAVASTYIKNGGQLMQYEISNSGIYQLRYTGQLDVYKGINQGSNVISTEYKFIGKDVVNAVNKLAKPYP
ncbi:RHS repeat-associated protein [Chryseobacterium sp. AG844]|nr:RHS repeat-associated protein [Chryseobacterium sp. AG844]